MSRRDRGTSAEEAKNYLASVFDAHNGFGLAVITTVDHEHRRALREQLVAAGAQLVVVAPAVEAVVEAPITEFDRQRPLVRWVESEDDTDEDRWRELAVALNRSREKLRREHRYLWVLAGPLSLRRIMSVHAQDIYSGAYKVPHVIGHAGAAITWLHLSDLQLGAAPRSFTAPRSAIIERAFTADLRHQLDIWEVVPDLVMISGDLAYSARQGEYEQVVEFLDLLLATLEAHHGTRPLVLAVPGNHDVERPRDLVERWQFEILRRLDQDDDAYASALRTRLWGQQDASLITPLFANYQLWAERQIFAALDPDPIRTLPGVCHVRSHVTSHVTGDWSVIVEKDDLSVAIIGLNTAWTSFVPEAQSHGALVLPFEQFEAALGHAGLSRLDEAHYSLLLTHHGPEALSQRSRTVLTRQIHASEGLVAHLHGHTHSGASAIQTTGPTIYGCPPLFSPRGGYLLGRIGRDGQLDMRTRTLVETEGGWRFDVNPIAVRGAGAASLVTAATEPGPDVADLIAPDELRRYLEKIAAMYAFVPMLGFHSMRVRLRIEELYVPLETTSQASNLRIPLAATFSHARALNRRGIILLGDPGSGKTTLLRHMLLNVVHTGPESLGLPTGTVPVFLSLSAVRDLEAGLPGIIQDQLRGPILDQPADFGRRLCRRGKLLLLIDGLDEIGDVSDRAKIARWLESALDSQPDSYMLVTSRYAGYTANVALPSSFLELHLPPIDDAQMRAIVRRWYVAVERHFTADAELAARRAEQHAADLLGTLEHPDVIASARLYELTRNPLLLATMCIVHHDRGSLPRVRANLYDACIDVLIERGQARAQSSGLPSEDILDVLSQIAAWMHAGRQISASRSELHAPIAAALANLRDPTFDAEHLLQLARDEIGLLAGSRVGEFSFTHRGFQEFLAARHLRNEGLVRPAAFDRLAANFDDSWWQEVILLMLALRDPGVFVPFMRALVRHPKFARWSESPMMRQCLDETATLSPGPFLELLAEENADDRQLAAVRLLARAMPEALEPHAEQLREHPNPAVRNWWATTRQQLPAPDRIVAPRSNVELVRVPAGLFSMGAPKDEVGQEPDETPQHIVELAGFYMARTPVTNAQYARYLEVHPDAAKPRYWSDRSFNQPNQPVVGVSWDDAQAYCEWAEFALPTEAQWEYACRAGTTTRYWSGGSEADLARVAWYTHNAEGQLHAVGDLPPNAYGLHDMHGNVREWCRDNYGPYTTSPRPSDGLRHEPLGDNSRVCRGGGWADPAEALRSSARNAILPDNRIFSLGFRVVMTLPEGHSP